MLRGTTRYYEVLRCTKRYYEVLRGGIVVVMVLVWCYGDVAGMVMVSCWYGAGMVLVCWAGAGLEPSELKQRGQKGS